MGTNTKAILFYCFALSLGAVFACSTDQTVKSVEYTCASATALLKVATANNTALSADARAKVSHAVTILNPVCSQPNPPTLDSTAYAALAGALIELEGAVK